jgi:hypothetical protein
MSNPHCKKELSHESVKSRDKLDRLPQYPLKKIPFDPINPLLNDSARISLMPKLGRLHRMMVVKAGKLVGIHLRPHDLRRHSATYASRGPACRLKS